jgi:hypothetical protein
MAEQVEAPTQDEARDFMRRLAEFRNGLPEDEQALMDALVARATTEDESARDESTEGEAAVSKAELDEFFTKLQRYRDELPEDDQRLMDDVVVAAGAVDVEPDVEAHQVIGGITPHPLQLITARIHWVRTGPISQASSYVEACDAGTGSQRFSITGDKIPFTASAVYTCRTWDTWG